MKRQLNQLCHTCRFKRFGAGVPSAVGLPVEPHGNHRAGSVVRRSYTRHAAFVIGLLAIMTWAAQPSPAQDITFNWNTDSSGYWHTAADWDLGSAPDGANHIVVIDRLAANPTITFNSTSGVRLVKSLTSDEKIILSGGTLELVDTGQFNNSFTIMGGTLEGGVITAGSGIDFNGSVNNRLDAVTLNGNLNLVGSSQYAKILNGLTLNGIASLTGYSSTLDFEGTQGLSADIGNTATVNLSYSSSQLRVTNGGTLTLDGTVTIAGQGYVSDSGTGGAIHNSGLIHANVNSKKLYINPATFTNDGTLRTSNNAKLYLYNDWDNNGTIELDGASLYLYGNFTTSDLNQPTFSRVGASSVYLGGALDNAGDTLDAIGEIDFVGGSVTGGTSNVDFNATGSTNEYADAVTLNADLNIGGNHNFRILNGLTLNGTANLMGNSSTLDFEGTQGLSADIGNTATVNLSYSSSQLRVTNGGTLTLDGTVTIAGQGYVSDSGTGGAIHNSGLIHANVNSKNLYISPATFTNDGTLRATNSGKLRLASGVLENYGIVEISGGGQLITTSLGTTGLENSLGGVLQGTGTVTGNVTNTAGTVAPGTSPGTLVINGNYVQGSGGNLFIELAGFDQGTEFDLLDISGTATLAGTLTVSLLSGFEPSMTDSFTFLEADGGLSGTFGDLIDLDGNIWNATYFPNHVSLSLLAVPEPGTHLLMALGALYLALRRQRA